MPGHVVRFAQHAIDDRAVYTMNVPICWANLEKKSGMLRSPYLLYDG